MTIPAELLPPGPRAPLPLSTLRWLRHPVEYMEECRTRYGHTFTIHVPPGRLVFLTRPEDIRAVFTAPADEMHAGEVNRILRALVGDHSVLLLDGAEHLRHRKLLLPSFQGDRMRHYGRTMVDITRRAIDAWPLGEPFSVHGTTQEITLEIILRTVFGAEAGSDVAELATQMKRLLKATERSLMMPLFFYLSMHPEVEDRAPWKWLLTERRRTDAMLFARIAARRADPSLAERTDVLSMLLRARDEAGEGMTDVEVRDELMTALAAGHETTATALAWAFERLLTHRPVLERLLAEVRAPEGGSVEKLATAPHLDATIKEVLRLRPIIPIVGRVLKKPIRLGGYDLPEGAIVAPCIYLTQRDPSVYAEPHAFKPDRFLGVQPDPYTWLPFGGGIRRCLGAAFATYEMKLVLGTMLRTCDFELAQAEPIRVRRRAVTFWPEHGTRLKVVRRVAQE